MDRPDEFGGGPVSSADIDDERVRPGLQHLFGARPGGSADWGADSELGDQASAWSSRPSPYLEAYESDDAWGIVPTGVRSLDDVLGGGVGHGVTVIGGDPGSGKSLLLEETARAALAGGWTVYLAAYREGALRVWERLMARASLDDGGLPLPLSAIEGRSLDPASRERLRALDAAFSERAGRRLVMVERLPAGRDPLRALLDGIAWRRRESREAGRPGPVVLIDDLLSLERMAAEVGAARPPWLLQGPSMAVERRALLGDLVGRLDSEMLKLGLACLVTGPPAVPDLFFGGDVATLDPGLRATTFLRLTLGRTDGGSEVPVESTVEKNGRTGWTGRVHLSLDRRTGRFGGW